MIDEPVTAPRRGGAERLAVVAGWDDTRAAFQRWNREPWRVVGQWAGTSLLLGIAMLVATWAVARFATEPTDQIFPSFSGDRTASLAAEIFFHNLLVLIMHALICIAGYMATQSVQIAADEYTGVTRWVHRAARPITLAFILIVTLVSFSSQAWQLGQVAPQVAEAYDMSIHGLLLALTPHALPELTAMFLPLGAWIVIARQRAWTELFAASILATAIALPILVMATLVEEFLTPILIERLAG